MRLSEPSARVLGSLVEKQLTTPQQYPLTLISLTAACNQTSNRDPVVDYDEQTVRSALDDLKELRLVRFVLPSHGRSVVRYRHVADETLSLDARRCALVAVLLLRGAQTVGELRIRSDRMTEFEGLDEIERELEWLASLDEPLVLNIGRRPGQKEERWSCTLGAASPMSSPTSESWDITIPNGSEDVGRRDDVPQAQPRDDELTEIRAELESLRSEVREIRRDLDALRQSLGD